MAIAADDAVWAVGKTVMGGGTKATVVRLTPDGTPDGTFGTGGVLRLNVPGASHSTAHAMALLGDGRIVLWGQATVGSGKKAKTRWFLARLWATGAPDAGFCTNGYALHDPSTTGGGKMRKALAILPDGSLVAGGGNPATLGQRWTVARFSSSGAFQGSVQRATGIFAGLAVDGAGRVVATGNTWVSGASTTSVVVARYLASGTGLVVDPTCGSGGEVVVGVPGYPQVRPTAGALDTAAGDSIVLAAYAYSTPGVQDVWTLRLTSGGALDASFGSGGRAGPLALLPFNDANAGVIVDGAGRAIVAGCSRAGSSSATGTDCLWFVARYLGS